MSLRTRGFIFLIYFVLSGLSIILSRIDLQNSLIGADQTGLTFWTTWWVHHAIQQNYDLVYNNYTLFPVNTNLLPVLSVPTGILYRTLADLFGAVLSYNVLFLIYTALNAFFAFLFARQYIARIALAFMVGLVSAFNPVTFQFARDAQLPLLGFFVIPLWLLLWDWFLKKPTLFRVLWAVFGLYLVVIMSIQYWNLIATILLPYAAYRIYLLKDRGKMIDPLILGALIFFILLYIYPASPFLWSTYLLFYSPLEIWQGIFRVDSAGTLLYIALGMILLLASIRWLGERRAPHHYWRVMIGFYFLWALLPAWSPLTILGNLFDVPHGAPLTRSGLFVQQLSFAVAMLAAVMIQERGWFPARVHRGVGVSLVVGVLSLSGWLRGFPAASLTQVAFYDQIALDPEDYLVAHFPMGVDSLSRRAIAASYDSGSLYADVLDEQIEEMLARYPVFGGETFADSVLTNVPLHRKRVFGGLASTFDIAEMGVYETNTMIRLLTAQEVEGDAEEIIRDIRNDTRRWRIGYVVINHQQTTPEFVLGLRQWLVLSGAYCLAGEENGLEFWRARWHPAGCPPQEIDFGSEDIARVLREGWYSAEDWSEQKVRWAGVDSVSHITLWARPGADYRLLLRASSPQIPQQEAQLVVNGEALGTQTLRTEWQTLEFQIPRRLVQDELLSIELRHKHILNLEGRAITAAYDWLRLEPIP